MSYRQGRATGNKPKRSQQAPKTGFCIDNDGAISFDMNRSFIQSITPIGSNSAPNETCPIQLDSIVNNDGRKPVMTNREAMSSIESQRFIKMGQNIRGDYSEDVIERRRVAFERGINHDRINLEIYEIKAKKNYNHTDYKRVGDKVAQKRVAVFDVFHGLGKHRRHRNIQNKDAKHPSLTGTAWNAANDMIDAAVKDLEDQWALGGRVNNLKSYDAAEMAFNAYWYFSQNTEPGKKREHSTEFIANQKALNDFHKEINATRGAKKKVKNQAKRARQAAARRARAQEQEGSTVVKPKAVYNGGCYSEDEEDDLQYMHSGYRGRTIEG